MKTFRCKKNKTMKKTEVILNAIETKWTRLFWNDAHLLTRKNKCYLLMNETHIFIND